VAFIMGGYSLIPLIVPRICFWFVLGFGGSVNVVFFSVLGGFFEMARIGNYINCLKFSTFFCKIQFLK
jgi:hypothetical protein